VEAAVSVGELPFVDEETGVDISPLDGIFDLIEGNDYRLEVRLEEAEGEAGAREHPGDRDPFAA